LSSKKTKFARKKQWGSESRTLPLSILHDKPSSSKMILSRLAIVLTIGFWGLYVISTIIRQFFEGHSTFAFTMQAIGYLFVVTFLTFSALMYLIQRQAAFQRFSKHVRVPRAKLDQYFYKNHPSITVLVPSYNEEPSVVRQTLLSAALQEYSEMRVVLLIDDPPNPQNPLIAEKLNTTRQLTNDIMLLFSEPKARFSKAILLFEKKYSKKNSVKHKDIKVLIDHYKWSLNLL
jgi:cellulose synthase/poly-beta-1,6-N-acetylglucosamine synthase-like glycosyltransferase